MNEMFLRWLSFALLLSISSQLNCGAQDLNDPENPAAHQSAGAREQRVRNILFLLSCSYAMRNPSTNRLTRMTQEKQVVEQLLQVLPNDLNIGLRTYGQGQGGYMEADCRDTQLIEPIGPKNKKKILEDIQELQPAGMSPLGYAVTASLESDFKTFSDPSLLILITGKGDTCVADISMLAKNIPLVLQGAPIRIYALDLNNHPDKRVNALFEFAKASGGRYYRFDQSDEFVADIKALCTVKHRKS